MFPLLAFAAMLWYHTWVAPSRRRTDQFIMIGLLVVGLLAFVGVMTLYLPFIKKM